MLADKCITNRRELVGEIEETLHLPKKRTKIGIDPHYRCFACLYGNDVDENRRDRVIDTIDTKEATGLFQDRNVDRVCASVTAPPAQSGFPSSCAELV